MLKDHLAPADPNKPALIVLAGATRRKYRPLTGDIVVMGSSMGCDIGMGSPEIAPVHCVLVHMVDGWRIRDCSGRCTRVNGQAITEEPLHNGDVIQMATFSFEVQLPRTLATPGGRSSLSPAKIDHLRASRRRLAELALGLRKRLREANDRAMELAQREQDLDQLEARLRSASQNRKPEAASESHLEQRKRELDEFAQQLLEQEAKLREQEEQLAHQVEAELLQERQEMEAERQALIELRMRLERRELERDDTWEQEEILREKELLEHERAQLASERAYLEQQRRELSQARGGQGTKKPIGSSETHMDGDIPPDRIESARRLLRQLAERRKTQVRPRA